MLELVGMKDVEDLRPSELSGGMKKRVALARAVIKNPEYILYDEPTTGLDPVMSSVIDNMIIKLSRELDVTSVVVTHDMTSVEKISDVVCMLYGGRIIFNGKVGMLKKSDNGIVRQFVNRESTGPIGFGR